MKRLAIASILASLVGSGCYLRPMKSNSPVQSQEGVHVTLLGEDCEDHVASGGTPISRDLVVKLKIENRGDQDLRVAARGVRLTVEQETAPPNDADEGEVVEREHSRILELRFLHHSTCKHDFAIAFKNVFTVNERRVELAALHVTPY